GLDGGEPDRGDGQRRELQRESALDADRLHARRGLPVVGADELDATVFQISRVVVAPVDLIRRVRDLVIEAGRKGEFYVRLRDVLMRLDLLLEVDGVRPSVRRPP